MGIDTLAGMVYQARLFKRNRDMKLELEPIEATEDELRRTGGGRVRLFVRDNEGAITDIFEGPLRFIVNEVLRRLEPGTNFGVRKVR